MDDTDAVAADINLQAIDPETYPANLIAVGERWLLWQSADGRKMPRNP